MPVEPMVPSRAPTGASATRSRARVNRAAEARILAGVRPLLPTIAGRVRCLAPALAALVLLAMLAAPATAVLQQPPPFDGDAAYAHVRTQVGFGPRFVGSEGHARQLEWMVAHLRARADTVELQRFTHRFQDGETRELTNVIARFRPDAAERVLLLTHWDTRSVADEEQDRSRREQPIPGANDGASGTAVLLEIADVLSRHPPPVGIDLLFIDGEDYAPGDMFLGAEHFADNLPPESERPRYGILLDMVGDTDPWFPMEENSRGHAPELLDRVWATAERLGYADFFVREDVPAVIDDHLPLNEAGLPTILIIDPDYGPDSSYWHTHDDDLRNTSPRGLEAVGRVVLAVVFEGG